MKTLLTLIIITSSFLTSLGQCSASFTLNSTDTAQVCKGATVNFDAAGSAPTAGFSITNYSWKFTDATTATGITATKTYANSGVFKERLTITDGNGCTKTVRKVVRVAEDMNFWGTHANRTTICQGDTTLLVGVVQQTKTTVVFPTPVSNGTPITDNGVFTSTVTYTQYDDNAVITSVADIVKAWANMQHSYSGDLYIRIVCPNGQQVSVYNVSGGYKGGGNGGTPFNQGTYNWTSTAATPMAGTGLAPGDYLPAAPFTSLIGCPANGTWQITIGDVHNNDVGTLYGFGVQLAPSMYKSGIFKPLTTAQAWQASPDIITTINDSTVIIAPTTAGTHSYTFEATNNFGCTQDTTITITVNPKPNSSFTSNVVCLGNATTFTNNSTIANGSLVSGWVLDAVANPPPTSTATNPSYTYANCNTNYNVALLTISDKGCKDTAIGIAKAYCLPTANFTVVNGCEDDAVIQFNNTSINGAGTMGVLNYAWNLSPTLTTVANPTQVYTMAGTKNITLIVTDVNSCSDTFTAPLQIYPKPTANFTVDSVCFNTISSFTNASTLIVPVGYTDAINNYQWNYNFDGVNYIVDATAQNTTHLYTLPATQVKPITSLIITTNHGCADTVSNPIIVWPLPVASYTMTSPCYPNPIVFTNASSINMGTNNSTMATMSINWGNGQASNVTGLNQTLNYNYTSSGNYISELSVATNHACTAKLQVPITIHAKPVASYVALPASGCSPVCVYFVNTSTQNASPIAEKITNYSWTYNDYTLGKPNDDKSSSINTYHCYKNSSDTIQLHSPRLIVTTSIGCKDTITQANAIVVYPLPIAGFELSDVNLTMLNPQVNITDQSHLANTVVWNYGNTDINSVHNPTPLTSTAPHLYTYNDSGVYIINQLVLTNHGCRDSVEHTITINPVYSVFVPNAFSPDGDGLNDYFKPHGQNIKTINLIIFNRWGDVVARVNDINSKGWDGTDMLQNKVSQQETYNWKLEYIDVFNIKHQGFVGTVTLLK